MLSLVLFCLFFLTAGESRQKPIAPKPENVSLIQLIASPEKFDGKMVSLVGFLGIEPEDARVYLSREDYQQYIPGNGVWVDVNKDMLRNVEDIDLHYVVLVGIFKLHGLPTHYPGGTGGGGITDVRQCTAWLTASERRPREPKQEQKKPR